MKLYKYISLALGIAMMPMLAACQDDEESIAQTPLDAPVITSTATFESIECTWNKVDGAVKYGYEFYDADGNLIVRDVTQDNSVTFTDLDPSTNYTFNIWSYGVYKSANGTSGTHSFEIRTNDLIKLGTPEITITKPVYNQAKITWTAVEDAEYYVYTVKNPNGLPVTNGQGKTEGTSLTFSNLNVYGVYNVTLYAATDKAGYSNGETVAATFEVEEPTAPPAPMANN